MWDLYEYRSNDRGLWLVVAGASAVVLLPFSTAVACCLLMFDLSNRDDPRPDTRQLKRIDRFVRDYRREMAALAWGYAQLVAERGGVPEYLGIDLQPQPHFITCTRPQLEALNATVDNRLREAIGVLDGYDPEKEVLIVGIANGQVQLVMFQCEDPTPAAEFAALGLDVDTLLDRLEVRMIEESIDS